MRTITVIYCLAIFMYVTLMYGMEINEWTEEIVEEGALPYLNKQKRSASQEFKIAYEGKCERQLSYQAEGTAVYALAYHPFLSNLLAVGVGNKLRLWDSDNFEAIPCGEHAPCHYISTIAFDTSGNECLTGGVDRTIRIWDIATQKELHNLNARGIVNSVVSYPGFNEVVICALSSPGRIGIVDIRFPTIMGFPKSHDGHGIYKVQTKPTDPNYIISLGADKTIRVWDRRMGQQLTPHITWEDNDIDVTTFAMDPDDGELAVQINKGTVGIVDCTHKDEKNIANLKGSLTLKDEEGEISSEHIRGLTYINDNSNYDHSKIKKMVIAHGKDVVLWDITYQTYGEVAHYTTNIQALASNPMRPAEIAAASTTEQKIKIWKISSYLKKEQAKRKRSKKRS